MDSRGCEAKKASHFSGSRHWLWLFPATYLAHIAEEYWGGFPDWASRAAGAPLTAERFLQLNTTGWILMLIGTGLAVSSRKFDWLAVTMGTVAAVNGVAHTIASALTWSYSPGLLTGLVFWLPFGVFVLASGAREVSRRQFLTGVAAGILIHAGITASIWL